MAAVPDLLDYLEASPSPYHAVANAAARLDEAGFRRLDESEAWDEASGVAYVIRGGALVAARAPADWRPTLRCASSARTDSPNLRLKPKPDTRCAGWRQLAVEVYGSPLVNSWLDRDLGLSGRVVLRGGETILLLFDRPLARIPQLEQYM